MKARRFRKLQMFIAGFLVVVGLSIGIERDIVNASSTSPVFFSDYDLEKKVRQALGFSSTREIYPLDMQSLTEFNASSSEINNLTGLEYAKNLKKINLSNNYFTYLTPLSNLTSLELLDLSNNDIKSINDLTNLQKLKSLKLNNTKVNSIYPLLNLNGLEYVELQGTDYLDWYDDFQKSSAKYVTGTLSYQRGVNVLEPDLQSQRLAIVSFEVTDHAIAFSWDYYGNRPDYFRISLNSKEVANVGPETRAFIVDGLTPHQEQKIRIDAVFSGNNFNTDVLDFFTYNNDSMAGWLELGTAKTYYNSETDTAVKHWLLDNGKWYYFDEITGIMETGWVQWNGKSYYMDVSGGMRTGWVKDKGVWYYFAKDGSLKSGWLSYKRNWYYLQGKHGMKVGWLQYNNKWYFHDYNGIMKTGWVKNLGKWYYMDSSGVMQKGWKYINYKWYYFYSNGEMAVNTYVGSYEIGQDGAWIK